MKIIEKYIVAFKSANVKNGKNILEKSHNWHTLEGRKLKQTLEIAFELADHLGVMSQRDKQGIIDRDPAYRWVEDNYLSLGNGEGDLTEYLELERGYIIRTVEWRETMKEMQARWDREYADRNKEN